MRFCHLLLLPFLLAWAGMGAYAQVSLPVTDVHPIDHYLALNKNIAYIIDSNGKTDFNRISGYSFMTGNSDAVITRKNFTQSFYFRLQLTNSGSLPDTIYFYPGNVIEVSLAEIQDGRAITFAAGNDSAFYSSILSSNIRVTPIVVQPGTVKTILVRPAFHYYNFFQWMPTLMRKKSANELAFDYYVKPEYNYIISTLFFMGILMTMFGFALIRYYQNKLPEFLYYALSTLCFVLYFAYQLLLNFTPSHAYHSMDSFLRQFLQLGAHVFYMLFAVHLLDIKNQLPKLYLLMKVLFILLIIYLTIICFTSFQDRYAVFNAAGFSIVRIILLAYSLYAIPVLFRHKSPIAKFVAVGALAVSVFAALAFYFTYASWVNDSRFFLLIGGPIAFFKLGILIEQIAFLLGLGRKVQLEDIDRMKAMQHLRLENEKKEIEKFMAVMETRDKERNRIAQEIHDDIGSGLTSIRLLSEIAKTKANTDDTFEINKISATANQLVENMNEIIWSVNSKNDSLPNLVAYIRSYLASYFESSDISVRINIPPVIPAIDFSGDHRRSIFLVVKETLHNIVKHSKAATVHFTIEIDQKMRIVIADDGVGFDESTVKPYSNGLRSMRERMRSIGGKFGITGQNGTTTTLEVPLEQAPQ